MKICGSATRKSAATTSQEQSWQPSVGFQLACHALGNVNVSPQLAGAIDNCETTSQLPTKLNIMALIGVCKTIALFTALITGWTLTVTLACSDEVRLDTIATTHTLAFIR